MPPIPTGRLIPTPSGRDLVLTRVFDADIDDVWASITESDRTARWFASWTGDAGSAAAVASALIAPGIPSSSWVSTPDARRLVR